jgi:hypothetical protein
VKYLAGVLALATLVASSASTAYAIVGHPEWPVHVSTCDPQLNPTLGYAPAYYPPSPFYWRDVYGYRYFEPPLRRVNPTLSIAYANATQMEMKSIEFGLVANGQLVAEVRDEGTFSPGAKIEHEFGLSPNVFPLQTGLPRCLPLRITYASGRMWRNPLLPSLNRKLY